MRTRDPRWAAAITGLSVAEIEAFAKLVGERKRSFFRLGYGFARQRNGAVAMHAALSIPTVTGAWQYEGGGAFHSNSGIFGWRKTLIEGLDAADPSVRQLDQSQIGRVLTGDAEALRHGPPVTAMLIQNTNPVSVAPEQELVKRGFARDDLFVCVHEQFMTETAEMADIVLPATMFMEHDDLYQAGGHQHILLGPKLVDPPGECRSNHEVIAGLAQRLGADHPGFAMTARALIDRTLRESGHGTSPSSKPRAGSTCSRRSASRTISTASRIRTAASASSPTGPARAAPALGPFGPWTSLPALPDHCGIIEGATEAHPFRLATSPARQFLNSSFNETPTSRAKEGRPEVMMHPDDAASAGIADGDWVRLRNERGEVLIRARLFAGVRRGVLIAEGLWPNAAFPDGRGINTLTGADAVAPYGGRCLPRQPRGAGARRHLARGRSRRTRPR